MSKAICSQNAMIMMPKNKQGQPTHILGRCLRSNFVSPSVLSAVEQRALLAVLSRLRTLSRGEQWMGSDWEAFALVPVVKSLLIQESTFEAFRTDWSLPLC